MENDKVPPCFEVVSVDAVRRNERVLQFVQLHSGAGFTFSFSDDQAVQLIGKLAASLHLHRAEPKPLPSPREDAIVTDAPHLGGS